jgi:hypothetical protein
MIIEAVENEIIVNLKSFRECTNANLGKEFDACAKDGMVYVFLPF